MHTFPVGSPTVVSTGQDRSELWEPVGLETGSVLWLHMVRAHAGHVPYFSWDWAWLVAIEVHDIGVEMPPSVQILAPHVQPQWLCLLQGSRKAVGSLAKIQEGCHGDFCSFCPPQKHGCYSRVPGVFPHQGLCCMSLSSNECLIVAQCNHLGHIKLVDSNNNSVALIMVHAV